jgi:upstream activation factor subunit UAF30
MTDNNLPTDEQIRIQMESLMKTVDLNTLSIKQFIAALSEKFGGADLSSKKKFIKSTITEILDAMGADDDDDDDGGDSSSDEEEQPKKKGGGGGGGGLSAVKEISPKLSAFLGCGTHAARTDVVKGMWDHIRENNLQDPNDKRQILLDDKMKEVFGSDVESFSMFTMNKYISPHIHPFNPLDLTPSAKKRKADDDGSGRRKGKKEKRGKNKNKGTQAPYRLSDDLSAVCGKSILPRPQVTQALWKYIRENDLQNPEDKREILCDEKLSRVLGGNSKVTMFSMNKYITAHLVEKMDKSAYVHEDIDSGKKEIDSDDESE